jgi:hypothetical protein
MRSGEATYDVLCVSLFLRTELWDVDLWALFLPAGFDYWAIPSNRGFIMWERAHGATTVGPDQVMAGLVGRPMSIVLNLGDIACFPE